MLVGRSTFLPCWRSVRWVVSGSDSVLLEVLDIVINGISEEVGDRLRDRHLLDGQPNQWVLLALTWTFICDHPSEGHQQRAPYAVPRRRSEIYLRASWRHIHQQGPEHPGFPASQTTGYALDDQSFASSPPLKNCSSVFTSSHYLDQKVCN